MKDIVARKYRGGFTLIELLVVIAIIAILAAILFPVFARAREKGRAASCLSNLKNIGSAVLMYQSDYDEIIIPWFVRPTSGATGQGFWPWLIQPYLKNTQVLFCPSFVERTLQLNAADPSCDGAGINAWFPAQQYFSHYGMGFNLGGLAAANGAVGGCTTGNPRENFAGNDVRILPLRATAAIIRPGETAILQDNFTGNMAPGIGVGTAFGCECGYSRAQQSRHMLGCNYMFIDGHAKLVQGNVELVPTIPCPGALSPANGQPNANCVCTQYTTFDY